MPHDEAARPIQSPSLPRYSPGMREGDANELGTRLAAIVHAAPSLMQVLRTVRGLGLPDWLVMSGAVYQPVLNHATGRAADYGVRDYDSGISTPQTFRTRPRTS